MSSSRNSTSKNVQHHQSPLINGSSSSSTKMMMDYQRANNHHHNNNNSDYMNDPTGGVMFHRSNSSRVSKSTSSSSASSSPSLSLARDGGVVLGSNGGPAAPSTGRSTNLVKQMVDNLYTNAVVNSQKNANNAVNSSTSPNHNLVNSTSASSIRSSFRNGPNGAAPQPPQPMSPSTQQRMFPLKSQFSEPSGHHHNHHHHQHQPSYDNLSPAPGFRNSPSLDRKSVTRASLPVGGSAAHLHHHNHNNNQNNNNSSPYYVRTGSGMSSASSTTSGGPQLYGQINQSSSKTSVKSYLDGDLIPEPGTPPGGGGAGGSSAQNGNTNHYGTSTWVEILEPRTRTKMFANLSTGECRWDEPKGVPILRATNPNITQWWELYDTKTQRFYYYSAKDFKTIWQKPTSPDAVVVPLAKLQIMKQNSSHGHGPHGAHLNESFDSGTGGGGSSSGHVTPSSPSLSSPSHLFPSGSQRFKGWSGPNGPFGPIHSPVTPPVADACTQTQNPVTSKPTMVSRWTQTTNITPTHVKIPRGRLDQSNGHQHQVNHHQSALYAASSQQHQQQHPQNYHRPSLQNYLLSEKRFAKGRYSIPVQGTGEELYDQVYGSGSGQNQNHLVYGNASDFYDQVAQDNQINHAHARNGFYEDVYDGYYGDEMLDYFDEDEDEDEDEFDDESDGDEDFDADDEFGGESVDEDDDEDEEEEEEEEDECDFDDSSEDDFVDGQKLARPYVRRPQKAQPNLPEESEVYSAQSEFTGDFVRGHQHRQPLQVATTNKTTVKIVSSTRVPTNDATTNKAVAMNQQQQNQNQTHAQQQQQQQNDGIRMSASFTAVDFKRNAVGRSSYTPSLHHHYSQQQQQNPNPNSVSNVPNQSLSQQQAPPQQQSYSNPFNSGSLRSSTGRIPSNATASGGSSNVPVASSGSVRTSGGNIADRINLFQSKLSTGGQASLGQAPSPVIIHRTPSSPPGVQLVQQQQTSTPLPVAPNSTTTRHSSGNDSATSNNLHRYFSSQQQSQQNNNQQPQQQQNQPSKSHSMTQITPNSGLNGAATPTASNVSKLSSNFSNLNVSNSSSKSQSPNSDTYYHIPPSSSTEALPGTGTPQISKRNFMGMTKNSSGNMDSTLEQGRHRTLSNTLGHSLSVSGSGTNTSGPLSITSPSGQSGAIQISSSTSSIYNRSSNSGTSFPNFNDSHLVMLNKSQSVAITPTSAGHGIGRGGSDPKNNNNNKKNNNKTKDNNKSNNNKSNNKENIKGPKSKESKLISGSPKKKKDIAGGGTAPPSNTSIESFAKECVSRHRKGGIFSKKKTLKSMLTHTKKPLKKPMISTISDSLLVKESVNCFKLIQIFMRDRVPSPAPGAEEPSTTTETTSSLPEALLSDEQILVRLISVCVQLVPLRDEVLVQVARQVTQNPSPDSEQRGLELLCALFWYFTASNKLGSHLHAFLAGHRNPFTVVVRRKFEQQMHRARHTHSHLFFRKPHSPEEVARVLRCVRAKHAGLFGETLTDGIVPGESDPKKQQLPWPVVLLTEALLEPRHEDREGVFRCVGDMDDVHKLKMKIDTTLPTDAHFPELIGRGPAGSKIPKLTDVHDLHVIASTLKLYFRELRDAVIPADLYLEALECAHSPARACGLLDKLPMVNRAALCYIIRFLQVFSAPDHVRDTKMDDANLSMVWAPNILRSLTPSPAGPNGVLLAAAAAAANNIYEQTRAEMSLVRTLIQHLDTNNAMVQ